MTSFPTSPVRWVPAAAMVLVVAAAGLGYYSITDDLAMLRWLDGIPVARLSAPARSKAVYRGVVVGPDARRTPLGHPAAAFWWLVEYRHKGNKRTVCSGLEQSELWLRDGGASARLAMLERLGGPQLAVTSDDRAWSYDYSDVPTVIDLASGAETDRTEAFPPWLGHCAGDRHHYVESHLPRGAYVELAACADAAGHLRLCDGPFGAVLSVGGLSVHRARRIEDALLGLSILGGILAAVLFAMVAVLGGWRDSVLRALATTPGRGRGTR